MEQWDLNPPTARRERQRRAPGRCRLGEAILADCKRIGVPFFGKQWGTYASNPLTRPYGQPEAELHDPPRNGKDGALIGGRFYREFPGRGRLLVA